MLGYHFIRRIMKYFRNKNSRTSGRNIIDENTETIILNSMFKYNIPFQSDEKFRSHAVYSCCARPSDGTVILAMALYKNETELSGFLHKIRSSISKKQDHFIFSYESSEQRTAIKEVLPMLLNGYFTEANEIMSEKIFIHLALIPNVIWFLNGGYLEIALAEVTEKMMKLLSETTGCTYHIYRNAIIKEDEFENEFDLLIDVNENLRFAIEAKSGLNFKDYAKYTVLMGRYGIIPDYFLLSQSCLPKAAAERIQDATGYQVCSSENYEASLQKMILRQIPILAEYHKLAG